MKVDGTSISAEQVSTWNTVYASAKEANGGAEDDRTMKIAVDAWRVMYSLSDGSWKRRETAKTTRGYSFPIRPEESSKVNEHGSSGRFIVEGDTPIYGGKAMSRRKVAERMFERTSVRFMPMSTEDDDSQLPEGVIMRVDGILGEVDKVNRNGRVYPRSLIETELKRVGQSMLDREVFVLADHPSMGEPFTGSVGKVAGIVVSATLASEPDNKIYGTFDIVDNQAGRDVAAIVRAGAKIGVSQRGIGSMEEGDIVDFEGRSRTANVVQNDYRLESWDIVIGPSADAHVTSFRESEENTMSLDSEKVREENPELIEDIKAEVATDVREEVAEEVSTKLEAEFDEKVARAVEARLAAEADAGNEAKIEEARVALESRISELEAANATAKTELDETKKNLSEFTSRMEKANGLRALLRDKLSTNPRLYVRVESVIFSELGEAQVDEDALDRIVGDAISSVSQPGPDAPPTGSGIVDIEEEKSADADRLDRINSMRTLAGLPTLESIPTT